MISGTHCIYEASRHGDDADEQSKNSSQKTPCHIANTYGASRLCDKRSQTFVVGSVGAVVAVEALGVVAMNIPFVVV